MRRRLHLSKLVRCRPTSPWPTSTCRLQDLADPPDIAETIAVACLGSKHLWQDLQLPSRSALSVLMRQWFPTLVALYVGGMKWKKFLYKQLCERQEIFVCKSPSCALCADHALCFGPGA